MEITRKIDSRDQRFNLHTSYDLHPPEKNPYRMPKTTMPALLVAPNIANIKMPEMNVMGIMTLNTPRWSERKFGMVRPIIEAALRIEI